MSLSAISVQAATYGDYQYSVSNGEARIDRYNGSGGSVTIPQSINGIPVTIIGNASFAVTSPLTSVTIPYGVRTIESWAFEGCRLTNVTIPNSVTRIGIEAFTGSGLTSIIIPGSVTSSEGSDYGAFSYCSNLTNVIIQNGVTRIPANAFQGCRLLTSVTIPSSVTSIGGCAFDYCTSLTSVTIPNSVTSIEIAAFRNTGLTSVTIPNSVTSLGVYGSTFSDCSSLTNVVIGTGVTQIPEQTFGNLSNLTSIRFLGNAPSVSGNPFLNTRTFVLNYHQGTTGWSSTFAGRPTTLIPDFYLNLLTSDWGKGSPVFPSASSFRPGTSVTVSAVPQPGYAFTSWSGDMTSSNNSLIIEMTSNKSVMANFGPDNADSDGDGLTNYQEVVVFNTNPNIAETTSPIPGLYLANQVQSSRTAGRADVTSTPNVYGLYTASQIHNLGLGGIVLDRNSNNEMVLNYQIMQSTDLQNWTPYQSYDLPITNAPSDKMFLRVQAVGQ